MAGLAADRKGGRPPTQALPRQARCLFGSDSTEPSANFLFRRVFFTRTGIHPGSSPGRLSLENATRDLCKPAE
jgi:hypothetical protein